MEGLFAKYEVGGTRLNRRQLFEAIENSLVRHAAIEELHLYPLIRARTGNGIRLAAGALEDHAEIEECLKRLHSLRSDSWKFDAEVRKLIKVVLLHVRKEEQIPGLFSLLRVEFAAQELEGLGQRLERSDQAYPYAFASLPTEPDSTTCHQDLRLIRSPVFRIAGGMAAAMGKARNAVSRRGKQL